jgi:hypothetical protein
MTLAAAGEAEAEQVIAAADKIRLEETGQLATNFFGELLLVERLEVFAGGQVGVLQVALDLALEPVVGLGLE